MSEPARPPAPSRISATTSKSPFLSESSGTSVTVTAPDELVALVLGVGARGFGELTRQGFGERGEPLEVGGREVDPDVVGRHRPSADPEGAARVEDPSDPVTDLDGLESAAEGLVEPAFDQPLEPALEPLESHGSECTGGPRRATGHPHGAVPNSGGRSENSHCYPGALSGEWRNWQTRRLQVPVSARTWGFKSPLAHGTGSGTAGQSSGPPP